MKLLNSTIIPCYSICEIFWKGQNNRGEEKSVILGADRWREGLTAMDNTEDWKGERLCYSFVFNSGNVNLYILKFKYTKEK